MMVKCLICFIIILNIMRVFQMLGEGDLIEFIDSVKYYYSLYNKKRIAYNVFTYIITCVGFVFALTLLSIATLVKTTINIILDTHEKICNFLDE